LVTLPVAVRYRRRDQPVSAASCRRPVGIQHVDKLVGSQCGLFCKASGEQNDRDIAYNLRRYDTQFAIPVPCAVEQSERTGKISSPVRTIPTVVQDCRRVVVLALRFS
jgi:hypothetical protein